MKHKCKTTGQFYSPLKSMSMKFKTTIAAIENILCEMHHGSPTDEEVLDGNSKNWRCDAFFEGQHMFHIKREKDSPLQVVEYSHVTMSWVECRDHFEGNKWTE
jgi:hypothetical protein